jgi:hypothetical protein
MPQESEKLMGTLQMVETTAAHMSQMIYLSRKESTKSLGETVKSCSGIEITGDGGLDLPHNLVDHNDKAMRKRKCRIGKDVWGKAASGSSKSVAMRSYRRQTISQRLQKGGSAYQQEFRALPTMINYVPRPPREKIIAGTKKKALK